MENIVRINEAFLQENNQFLTDLISKLSSIIENINKFFMNKELIIEK